MNRNGNVSSVIKKLIKRNIKENMPRNALFVFVVIIFTSAIVTLNILDTSAYYNIQSFYLQQYGSKGHVSIKNLSDKEIEKIKENDNVEGVGTSIYIGNVINEELHGKPVELRYADTLYTDYVFSKIEQGRMPKTTDEIALDTAILKDFGIEDGLGKTIVLNYVQNEQAMQKAFKIVGISNSSKIAPKHMIWVSDSMLDKNTEANNNTEIVLKKSEIDTTEKFLVDMQLENEDYCINEVYNERISMGIQQDTLVYKVGIIAVLICGFLILHSIFHIAYMTDMKLYGRMKILGATHRQIRNAVLIQYFVSCLPGILFGLGIGFLVSKFLLIPVSKNLPITPNMYTEVWNFCIAILLVSLSVLIAGFGPARAAGRINPSDLISAEDNLYINSKAERRLPGIPVLFQMAMYNMGRNKRKNLFVVFLLTIGILSIGCVYVIQKSFNLKLYMEEIALSDFTLSECSLLDPWGEYNPKGTTISNEVLENIKDLSGIYETGLLYSQEITLNLSDRAYDNVVRYYEQNDGEILKYMEQSIGWTEGYYKLKESHTCTATIFGVDGLINDKLVANTRLLDGKMDKEKFLSGNYVLAQGMEGNNSSYEHPTYSVGDKVTIGEEEYEVMAIISAPYPVIEGKVNSRDEFNLQFFMPNSKFCQLYPENTVRRLFINADINEKEFIQTFLEDYTEKNNIPMISEKSIAQEYKEETKSSMIITNIIALMIFAIGVINMINSIITSVNIRKKEFAMMQSVGMTKRQLRILLIFESMGLVTISLFISYFLSFLVINTAVKAYLTTQWTATYNFTITPLLIITPVLILLALLVPLLCFNYMQKKEIIDRLENDIE